MTSQDNNFLFNKNASNFAALLLAIVVLVYNITKTFWENVDQITSDAPWAKQLDVAFAPKNVGGLTIHPGAARYYREVGVLE